MSGGSGAAQNSGTVRGASAPSIATVLPQPVRTAVGRGAVAVQDKAGNLANVRVFYGLFLFSRC